MTDTTDTTETSSATGWNPLGRPDPVTLPLEVSGGKASATFRAWSARERLAYEDRSLSILGKDADGEATVRMGQLNALALTLTLVSVDGFPSTVTREGPDGEKLEEPLDLRRIEHLYELDAATYAELVKLSRTVQPLPGFEELGGDEEPQDGDSSSAGDDPDAEDDGPELDPTTTSSTPPAGSGLVAVSTAPAAQTG